jgi:hypothetical protein
MIDATAGAQPYHGRRLTGGGFSIPSVKAQLSRKLKPMTSRSRIARVVASCASWPRIFGGALGAVLLIVADPCHQPCDFRSGGAVEGREKRRWLTILSGISTA